MVGCDVSYGYNGELWKNKYKSVCVRCHPGFGGNLEWIFSISVPAMLRLISYCIRPPKCVCKCVFVYLFSDSLMHENNPSLGRLLICSAACRCRTYIQNHRLVFLSRYTFWDSRAPRLHMQVKLNVIFLMPLCMFKDSHNLHLKFTQINAAAISHGIWII